MNSCFELLLDLRDGMQAAGADAGRGRGEVDPLGFEARVQRLRFERGFAGFDLRFEVLLDGVQQLCRCGRAPPGVSLPNSLLISASLPLRPSASTRTASTASSVDAAFELLRARSACRSARWCSDRPADHLKLRSVRFQKIDHGLLAFGQREVESALIVFGAGLHVRAGRQPALRAISRSPFCAAACRGVQPPCWRALTVAPWSIRSFTISAAGPRRRRGGACSASDWWSARSPARLCSAAAARRPACRKTRPDAAASSRRC